MMKKYLFGVDLGGTTVKNGIFTTDGQLLCKWEIPTRKENNGEYILSDIVASCKAKAEEENYPYDEFEGIGIGVPGAVGSDGIVHGCVNLGWGEKNVKEEMESLSGLTVAVGNDANVAALGEMWMGAGKGHRDVVMVTLGTGVGGGVIVDGRLVTGAHGFGAEIGHLRVNMHEKEDTCNCGKMGCLEQYCSATGIARQTVKALAASDETSVLRDVENITTKDVFDAAKASDAFAIKQVEVFGRRLARGLSFVAGVVDPEIFVIGGGVSKAGSIVTEVVKRYYNDYVYGLQRNVEFVLAQLGNDAGIYGCAKLVLQ